MGALETVKELGTLDNNVHPFALVRPAFAEALVRVPVNSARRGALSLKDVFQRNLPSAGSLSHNCPTRTWPERSRPLNLLGWDIP
jgi:hypothetical protein